MSETESENLLACFVESRHALKFKNINSTYDLVLSKPYRFETVCDDMLACSIYLWAERVTENYTPNWWHRLAAIVPSVRFYNPVSASLSVPYRIIMNEVDATLLLLTLTTER